LSDTQPLPADNGGADPRRNLERLEDWFSLFRACIIAFSGGVDSSLLAYCSVRKLGSNAYAVISRSPALSDSELLAARSVAGEIGIQLFEAEQDDLSDAGYIANGVDRCYFCRRNLAKAIKPIAERLSADVWVDGTHSDDMKSPRPGIKALREAGFRAPLLELGFRKEDIRIMARAAGLKNWDKPSEACLSSRISYGQKIDLELLRRIEVAEKIVGNLTNASIVRVRTIGKRAIVEVDTRCVEKAVSLESQISNALLKLGFEYVEIDREGYVSGKLLRLFVQNNY
jgi:uncharacterized protein